MAYYPKDHTPSEALTVTPVAIEQAQAFLNTEGVDALQQLADMPDATFTISRPLLEPIPAWVEPLQTYVYDVIKGDAPRTLWHRAGIMEPGNVGAIYFNSEFRASPRSKQMEGVGNLALAVNLCQMLPNTASQPATVRVSKHGITAPKTFRRHVWLGIKDAMVATEMAAVSERAETLLGGGSDSGHVPVRLAYVERGSRFATLKTGALGRGMSEAVPLDTPLRLGRVCFRIYPADTSPYRRLE